jgi:hypothetical protein
MVRAVGILARSRAVSKTAATPEPLSFAPELTFTESAWEPTTTI